MEDQNIDQEYIGLTIEEARNKANEENRPHRVVSTDGRASIITCDMKINRLNFTVKEGIVTKITRG